MRSATNSTNVTNILIPDVYLIIFSHINGETRSRLCTVSKQWHQILNDVINTKLPIGYVPQQHKHSYLSDLIPSIIVSDYHLYVREKTPMCSRIVVKYGDSAVIDHYYDQLHKSEYSKINFTIELAEHRDDIRISDKPGVMINASRIYKILCKSGNRRSLEDFLTAMTVKGVSIWDLEAHIIRIIVDGDVTTISELALEPFVGDIGRIFYSCCVRASVTSIEAFEARVVETLEIPLVDDFVPGLCSACIGGNIGVVKWILDGRVSGPMMLPFLLAVNLYHADIADYIARKYAIDYTKALFKIRHRPRALHIFLEIARKYAPGIITTILLHDLIELIPQSEIYAAYVMKRIRCMKKGNNISK